MQKLWENILALWSACDYNKPDPPANHDRVERAQNRLGVSFPEVVVEYFLTFGATNPAWDDNKANGPIYLGSIDDVVDFTLGQRKEFSEHYPANDPRLKTSFYHPLLIWIGGAQALSYYIDLDPGPSGMTGQIVMSDCGKLEITDLSILHFLERGIECLKAEINRV